MAIQWFPGHMHATRQAIQDRLKEGIDVVIELIDARCPGSSANPLLADMTGHKPTLKLLNKQDLADPIRTDAWLAAYNARPATRALAVDSQQAAPVKALLQAVRELAPHRGGMVKPLRVLICGIPNVGKSTLINRLMGRKATKTGDEPGITKVEQKLQLANDVYLFDTPGMLWPRIHIPEAGQNLAASGAVGRNAFSEELVALDLLRDLRRDYPALLEARYALGALVVDPATDDEAVLAAIGRKRGAMQSGGRVNLQKAAEVLIYEFRQGVLGRITLETPEAFRAWEAAAAVAEVERVARQAARKAARRGGRRGASAEELAEGVDEPEA
ncbi:ribosome biogenesis GTPase YlqF [Inhella gelatinilytica]|uniref:Ribosome biogenesis GTPase A n=1 Tax=Inhella gelatinilytica TaxID=2795030 RepID=A0A931IRI9_9BURK|nr:ribosome biogenesis GTPase YlqF [Inhella gelatinilytica]MBH9551362.1 ribosome biogenesis GTPase YlqF [Inhella gelatinilytica]